MPKRPPKALLDMGRTFEIEVYRGHLKAYPEDVDVLEALGHVLTRCGRFQEGLEADRLLVSLRPEAPVAHYNLACSLSLTSDFEGALLSLEKAIDLGYREFDFMRKDKDLKALRTDPRFEALLKKYEQAS